MSKWSAIAAAVAAASLSAGCALMGGDSSLPPDPRRGEAVDSLCFIRSINGFGEATDRTIVVRSGAHTFYQLKTVTACDGLERAQSVAFNSVGSCLVPGDKLFPFNSPVGHWVTDPPAFGCMIDTIYRWNPDAGKPDPAE